MWWRGEWVDDDFNTSRGGLRDVCFEPAGQHTTSSPRADGDVGEGVLFSESESRGDFVSINVEDM